MEVHITIKTLGKGDNAALSRVAGGVFDNAADPRYVDEFLNDPRHHLVIAQDGDTVVGFVSSVNYVHPDKQVELWINEVGVADAYRRQGIGRMLLQASMELGRSLGCSEAWVLTDRANLPAMRLYETVGGREADEDTVMFSFDLNDRRAD